MEQAIGAAAGRIRFRFLVDSERITKKWNHDGKEGSKMLGELVSRKGESRNRSRQLPRA